MNWATASELNNEGFEVQRSPDGRNWSVLDFIDGHGTIFTQQNYTYADYRPIPGINYYRLRQIDFDGQYELTKVVVIDWAANGKEALLVFPNPVTANVVSLRFPAPRQAAWEIRLINALGETVRKRRLEGIAPSMLEWDITGVPPGTYWLQASNGSTEWAQRLIIQ